MLARLAELEKVSRLLEPADRDRDRWNLAAQRYTDDFLTSISRLNAFEQKEDNGGAILNLDIREEGRSIESVLETYRANVDRVGINPASGKHFGYVPGGGVFPTALGDYLAAATNRYAGIFFANPGAVRIENQLLRWMCRMVGYPEGSLGNLTSGGSIANLIAITTARDAHGIRARELEHHTIYLTHQVHHCVQKALRIAGLAEAPIRYIAMDDQYRMNPDALRRQVETDRAQGFRPFLVVASAGTTDTGAVDPLDAIADVAEAYGLWYHVDAAYGGFFMLVDHLRPLFRGIERSDSLAIDPHKGLFLAYGIGAVLIKDVEAQYRAHYYQANYMQDALADEVEWSPADLSPELTKHFRGMRMWLPLQLLGVRPFRAALEEKVLLCRYFHQKIREAGFETGPYPDLSITFFRYLPAQGEANAFNEALLRYVQQDGQVFLSSTTIDGVFWIRMAILSFRSHRPEVDLCLELLRKALQEIRPPRS